MNPDRRAFVGLGSNLSGPERQVRRALEALERLPGTRWVGASSLYRSRPWGRGDQPDFINAVAALDADLSPPRLLDLLKAMERDAGRVRDGERWGPRVLDLDLLLYGDRRMDSPELTLPHPRMHERAFVLVPLLDLNPDIEIPGYGPVAALLESLDAGGVSRLGNAG